jgi:hypothetical protein
MATTELTVMLGRLLERTDLRAVEQRIRPTGLAAEARPAGGGDGRPECLTVTSAAPFPSDS